MKPLNSIEGIEERISQLSMFINFQSMDYTGHFRTHIFNPSYLSKEIIEAQQKAVAFEQWAETYKRLKEKANKRMALRLKKADMRYPFGYRNFVDPDIGRERKFKVIGQKISEVLNGTTPVSYFSTLLRGSDFASYLSAAIKSSDTLKERFKQYRCGVCGDMHLGEFVVVEGVQHCPVCVDEYLIKTEDIGYVPRRHARRFVTSIDDFECGRIRYFGGSTFAIDNGLAVVTTSAYGEVYCPEQVRTHIILNISGVEPPIGGYHSSKGKVGTFVGDAKNAPFMGMELEMEVLESGKLEDKAMGVLRTLGVVSWGGKASRYCATERDGSISYGFEMVTAPCTLDVHQQHLTNLAKCTEKMASHNTMTCGLHVHIDKRGTTALHRGKMVQFVNNPVNKELIVAVARRYKPDVGYARIKAKTILDGQDKYAKDRYEAVNLTNSKTIEFRIFKGTLRYESIMACLEFTLAVWKFAKFAGFNELTHKHFIDYISRPECAGETRYLRQILVERKVMSSKPPLREVSSAPAGEE